MNLLRVVTEYVRIYRWLSFGVGLSFAVLAISLFVARGTRYFPENAPATERSTMALHQTETKDAIGSLPGAPEPIERTNFAVSYPSSMRENETKTVDLIYTEATVAGQTVRSEKLRMPSAASLQTSAFHVSPQAEIKKPKGEVTPVEYVWTITPKQEGNHLVLLDVSALYRTPKGHTRSLQTTLSLNGNEQSTQGSGVLRLPIRVYNVWSMTRTTFDALVGVAALLGGALTFPLLGPLFKRRFGSEKPGANKTPAPTLQAPYKTTVREGAPSRSFSNTAEISRPIDIFFSYAHEDEALMDEVRRQLIGYDRRGIIRKWHDRQLAPGSEWRGQIDERLFRSDIILLFITPHFIESRYCYDVEMAEALRRHDANEARVIPIILRPCLWEDEPFARFQVVPVDGKPLTTWPNRDEGALNAAQGIMSVVWELIGTRPNRREGGAQPLV